MRHVLDILSDPFAVCCFANMAKRKETVTTEVRGDKLEITPLGAGNEVGRSSVFMTFKGKNILVRAQREKLSCVRGGASSKPGEKENESESWGPLESGDFKTTFSRPQP